MLQGYYRWKTIRDESIKLALPEKIQKAKDYTLAVADGLDTEGLTPELNEKLAKVDFNKVNRKEAIKRLMRELSDVKLLPDVSDQLEQVLREADPQAGRKKVLEEHGGISSYLRHLVTCYECQQPSSQSSLSGYKPLAQIMDICDYINYLCTFVVAANLWIVLFLIAQIESDRGDLIDELWIFAFNMVSMGFSCSALKYRFKCYGGGTGSGEGSGGGSKDDGGAEKITYESR